MWIQILQAPFFLKLLRRSRPTLPHPGANGFADLQRTYTIILYYNCIILYKKGHQMLLMKALIYATLIKPPWFGLC